MFPVTTLQGLGKSSKQSASALLPAGIVASSVTPFSTEGQIDLELLKPHIDWVIGEGANARSPLGSSGEFCAPGDQGTQALSRGHRAEQWPGCFVGRNTSLQHLVDHRIIKTRRGCRGGCPVDSAAILFGSHCRTDDGSLSAHRQRCRAVDHFYHSVPLTCVDLEDGSAVGALPRARHRCGQDVRPERMCQLCMNPMEG
jgi:hypothetical protein